MEGFRIDPKTFLAWLCQTNTIQLSEYKYQASFGVIFLGQNPLTFMIPIILYIMDALDELLLSEGMCTLPQGCVPTQSRW